MVWSLLYEPGKVKDFHLPSFSQRQRPTCASSFVSATLSKGIGSKALHTTLHQLLLQRIGKILKSSFNFDCQTDLAAHLVRTWSSHVKLFQNLLREGKSIQEVWLWLGVEWIKTQQTQRESKSVWLREFWLRIGYIEGILKIKLYLTSQGL